jgi:hypothetical protein
MKLSGYVKHISASGLIKGRQLPPLLEHGKFFLWIPLRPDLSFLLIVTGDGRSRNGTYLRKNKLLPGLLKLLPQPQLFSSGRATSSKDPCLAPWGIWRRLIGHTGHLRQQIFHLDFFTDVLLCYTIYLIRTLLIPGTDSVLSVFYPLICILGHFSVVETLLDWGTTRVATRYFAN